METGMRGSVALLFLTAALSAQTPEHPQPEGIVRGFVRDTAGNPAAGVVVTGTRNLTVSGGIRGNVTPVRM
jgi:hypothetical protein